MGFVRFLCFAAVVGLSFSAAAAEPRDVVATTEMDDQAVGAQQITTSAAKDVIATAPVEDDGAAAGHQASDAELPAAVPEQTPKDVVKAEPLEPPKPTLFADIDLTTQRMTVRDSKGHEYGPWKISSARGGYKTPTGTYTVHYTARMHYSKQYHWSPMPYSVFFNRGVAVHGTNAVGRLGSPASHGCVRVHPRDAKTFYNLVEKHGMALTRVTVHGTPPYSPAVAERTSRRRYQQPSFQPFGFFAAQPPSYEPRKRRYRRQQYGAGY